MREWVVLSGKGGTGKTSVAAALAYLAAQELKLVLADADVDAANLELLLSPERVEEHNFFASQMAVVEAERCTGCGRCAEVCRFAAITPGLPCTVDALACEGCVACYYVCPQNAIRIEERLAGQWYCSESRVGALVHARLKPGRENSGKLVTQVKMAARLLAARQRADLLLVDGPPGIGCPVIAAASGAQLALLVAEPTVSGQHDLGRMLDTVRHFRVPAVVCLNKADLSPRLAGQIEAFCAQEGTPLAGAIPFDEEVVRAAVERRPVTVGPCGPAATALTELWQSLRTRYLERHPAEGDEI